jgi:hypothetical protein
MGVGWVYSFASKAPSPSASRQIHSPLAVDAAARAASPMVPFGKTAHRESHFAIGSRGEAEHLQRLGIHVGDEEESLARDARTQVEEMWLEMRRGCPDI